MTYHDKSPPHVRVIIIVGGMLGSWALVGLVAYAIFVGFAR